MSKPTRDSQLRLGEQRMREWQVAADAGVEALRSLTGRDPAADLAIAARLGAHADPASIDALLAMEAASTDKLLHKEIRRSLYRLEQRGLAVPEAPAAPLAIPAQVLEGYLSPVDGSGDQLVWLIKARPSGIAHVFAVINDPGGLREVDLSETTRKALRAAREQLLERHELRLVDADWRYCDFIIDRALRWANERGGSISGDYRGMRAQLIKQPVAAMPPLIFAHLDAEAVRRDPEALAGSEKLIEEKEFRTWFFVGETLKPYLDEIAEIKNSPLVLAPPQQEERIRGVVERAIEELFGGGMQQSWVRRLEEMAYFFHATARREQAKHALAAALALEASTRGGRDIVVCEQITRASLAAFLQAEEQREAEAARTSLLVTPQQAAREAQRRR